MAMTAYERGAGSSNNGNSSSSSYDGGSRGVVGGGGGGSSSSSMITSTPRIRQALLDAVYEASAAVTHSVLCNATYLPPPPPSSSAALTSSSSSSGGGGGGSGSSNNNGGGGGNGSGSGDGEAAGTMGYVTAAARQAYLTEGTRRVRQLLDEYETLMLQTVERDAQRLVAPTTVAAAAAALSTSSLDGDGGAGDRQQSVVALRARANAKLFAEACELAVPLSEYRQPDGTRNGGRRHSGVGKDEASEAQRLRPLTQLLQHVRDVRRCAGYKHEEHVHQLREKLASEDKATASTSSYSGGGGNSSSSSRQGELTAATTYHIPAAVRRLEEAIETCLDLLRGGGGGDGGGVAGDGGYVACASSTPLISGMATWPQGLLRLVNEAVQSDTLESRVDGLREQLRRARFDVDELQQQQEQAVTDGDMHRSEELYFQQVGVLEAMTSQFDALEEAMQRYRDDCGEAARARLASFVQSFRATMQSAVAAESAMRRRLGDDLDRLCATRDAVAQARAAQRTASQVYTTEWRRVYDDNAKQQAACLRAMDELERRLHSLGSEAEWLVRDRAAHVQRERQRDEDALAFERFADDRTAALTRSLRHVETAMRALQTMGDAVHSGSEHLDAYLRETVQMHTDDALLRVRKQRLEQFRSLYLTLGDLQFKKARHAEEVVKKIEYYTLQQEIAMDALNPKAKEYSQAKRQWQAVEQEMQEQLAALEQRSAQQLADFRPTEARLIEAGVAFTHPQDELAERNFSRTQKLLEYKRLMEAKAEEVSKTKARGDGGDNGDDDGGGSGGTDADVAAAQLRSKYPPASTQRSDTHGGGRGANGKAAATASPRRTARERSDSDERSGDDDEAHYAVAPRRGSGGSRPPHSSAYHRGGRGEDDDGGGGDGDGDGRRRRDAEDAAWRRSAGCGTTEKSGASALRATDGHEPRRNDAPPSVRGGRRW